MIEGVARECVRAFVTDTERHIGDGQPHLQKHLLVERLHLHNIFCVDMRYARFARYDRRVFVIPRPQAERISVYICGRNQDRQIVDFADRLGVFVEVAGVRLEVDDAVGCEDLTVTLQEEGRGQAGVFAAAELGVGEGEPNFGDFFRAEEGIYELDAGAEERHVGQGVLRGILGAFPEAGALDVHAYVVHVGVTESQGNGVVSFTAAQFQHNGIAVAKHLRSPVALDGVVVELELLGAGLLGQHFGGVRLQEAAERLVLGEFLKLSVSHQSLCFLTTRPRPRSGSTCERSSALMVSVHWPGWAGRTSAL